MLEHDSTTDAAPDPDGELLDKAKHAANGVRFRQRFESSFEGTILEDWYDSRRQAEMALMANLAFWTRADRVRMQRLFERSTLHQTGPEREDEYLEDLVAEAVELVDDEYDPEFNS